MSTEPELIARYYDVQPEQEWERMDNHRTEFGITLRALAERLPPPPACILDCGGGPGRYSLELARQGYSVTLFDLSAGNMALARRKAAEAGLELQAYEQGTALDLSRFAPGQFDAVLLMGPLYHLLEEHERLQALLEAYRVLKPGGVLFAAFIARYAAHIDLAEKNPNWILEKPEDGERILATGQLPWRGSGEPVFVAYFAHPTEVEPLIRIGGFEVDSILALEGLVAQAEEEINTLSGEAWQAWLDVNYRVATDPSIHGGVEHLLAVAVKPRWKAALRRVAARLSAAGVRYRVVGGAAVRLHGLPLPVKDVDLELSAGGAYRFQELFASEATLPVAWREGETYRSHFGRFLIDGVQFEPMSDLERREGEAWVPSMTATETVIDLEGTPVPVSWLEEEALAYLRRKRLDRAALCLPHCDPDRLLRLIRGEISTNVI